MKTFKVEMVSKIVLTVPRLVFSISLTFLWPQILFIYLSKKKLVYYFFLLSPPSCLIFSTLWSRRLASMDSFALWLLLGFPVGNTGKDWRLGGERSWESIVLISPWQEVAMFFHIHWCVSGPFLLWLSLWL